MSSEVKEDVASVFESSTSSVSGSAKGDGQRTLEQGQQQNSIADDNTASTKNENEGPSSDVTSLATSVGTGLNVDESIVDGSSNLDDSSSNIEHVVDDALDGPEDTSEAFFCPLHKSILHTLKKSKVLSPVFVGVKNLSYWYAQRKLLGPKRQNSLPIRQNPISMRWESNVFKMKVDEETGIRTPQKSLVANHNTRFQAFKRSEQEAKLRDQCPGDNEKLRKYIDMETLEATHFRIICVSAAFDRVDPTERAVLIYEALTRGMGSNLIPGFKGLGQCPPVKMKMASTFGLQTCSLPIYQFLLPQNKPLHLIIEAFTPSQWKPKVYAAPDSERFGRTHLGFRSLEIPLPLLPQAHKTRVKKLSQLQVEDVKLPQIEAGRKPKYAHSNLPPTLRKVDLDSLDQKSIENLSVGESLGVEPSISGMEYKRLGGIYGHYLRDMPEEIRKKVMDKFKDGKLLIQKEGQGVDPDEVEAEKARKKAQKESFQPRTMLQKMKEKAEAKKIEADYDKGTHSEQEMMEEIYIAGRKIERWALRVQRLRRLNITVRAAKRVWKRHFAAIVIQKLVRGHYGRQYAKILAKLVPKAVARIKKAYFLFKAKYIIKKWQFLHSKVSKRLIPKMKKFIANIARSWLRLHHKMATRIQALVRMFIQKARFTYKVGAIYYLGSILDDAATKIQKIHRGNRGRARIPALWEKILHEKIDKKAAVRIQRVQRGIFGRARAAKRALQIKSANLIQRNARRFVRHCWEAQMRYIKKINIAATQIQKIARARIDNKLFRSIYKKWYYQFRFIPAIIKLQSIARRFSQMKKYKILKRQWKAATKIQNAYRYVLRRREALMRWEAAKRRMRDNTAAIIQKWIRRMIARIRFEEKKLAYEGKKILAVKKIMRAWVSFKQYSRFQMLIDDHRLLLFKARLRKLCASRNDLYSDLHEIDLDIERVKKVIIKLKARIKEVNLFTLQAANRLPFISTEMSKMTVEDFERGWAEAFGQEFESLTNMNNQALQELRLLKNLVMKRERELLLYYCEKEEAHIEMDTICVLELEAYEGLRRAELKKINRRVNQKWDRLVRQEKMRWKSDATRYNVIMRQRPGWSKIIETSMATTKSGVGRDMLYAQTIAFEKRSKVWDKEEIIKEKLIKEDGLLNGSSYKGYEKYIAPIVDTYDLVLNNTKQTLRGFAVDNSANLIKKQYQHVQKLKETSQPGQFAPLKDEFQMSQGLSFKEQMKQSMKKDENANLGGK